MHDDTKGVVPNDRSNPHDRMFREIQANRGSGIDLLRATLPASVSEKLDYESLETCSELYVDT